MQSNRRKLGFPAIKPAITLSIGGWLHLSKASDWTQIEYRLAGQAIFMKYSVIAL